MNSNAHDEAYHAHYCEENVYKLAYKYKNLICEGEEYDSYVVFISNDAKQTPLWEQNLAPAPGQPVVWDYHVVFMIRSEEGVSVIDLDTTLGYRVPFEEYMKKTFRPDVPLTNEEQIQKFRVVHANTFLDHFASNRSHMIDFDRMGSGGQRERARSISGEGRERTESTDQYRKRAKSIVYTQPPPSWPPIYGPKADTDMNLTHYIDMDPSTDSDIFGKVYSLKDFIAFGTSNA